MKHVFIYISCYKSSPKLLNLCVVLWSLFVDFNGFYHDDFSERSKCSSNTDIIPHMSDIMKYEYDDLVNKSVYIQTNKDCIRSHVFFNVDYKNNNNEINQFKQLLLDKNVELLKTMKSNIEIHRSNSSIDIDKYLKYLDLINSIVCEIINDTNNYIYGLGSDNELLGVNGAKNASIQHFISNADDNSYIHFFR